MGNIILSIATGKRAKHVKEGLINMGGGHSANM